MKLSVIIPVYNEEKVIADCLESLGNQTYDDFEIIIVDDGSTDSTLQILKNIKEIYKDLIILKQKHKGPAMARNKGSKEAHGKILVFVDADMTFEKDFLEKLTKPIREGESRGTNSISEYVSNYDNRWARCYSRARGWHEDTLHNNSNQPTKSNVFRAILKSEFKKIDGFDYGGYTDDYTLSEKLGYDADIVKAKFYHKNPDNMQDVFIQAKWSAKREYKLGFLGKIIALIRSSFPISLLRGLYFSLIYKNIFCIIFLLVYDFAIFVGLLEMIFLNKQIK